MNEPNEKAAPTKEETEFRAVSCIVCGIACEAKMYGAGDGTGQLFRCPECHWRHEAAAERARAEDAERVKNETLDYLVTMTRERDDLRHRLAEVTREREEARAALESRGRSS